MLSQVCLTLFNDQGMMRNVFLTGWILLFGAFAAAAAETVARTLPGGSGWTLSADELWQALWPGSYLLAEIRLNALHPWFWDPVISWFLVPPAWFLLAVPGVILSWTCRPNRVLSAHAEEELREHEVSLFLYDELAREARKWAREEGDTSNDDDRLPSHDMINVYAEIDDDDFDPAPEPLPEFVKPQGPQGS